MQAILINADYKKYLGILKIWLIYQDVSQQSTCQCIASVDREKLLKLKKRLRNCYYSVFLIVARGITLLSYRKRVNMFLYTANWIRF